MPARLRSRADEYFSSGASEQLDYDQRVMNRQTSTRRAVSPAAVLVYGLAAGLTLLASLALLKRRRSWPRPANVLAAAPITPASVPSPAPPPTTVTIPEHPLRQSRLARWLLFLSAALGLALIITALERPYNLAALALVMGAAGVAAYRRPTAALLLRRAQQLWADRRLRGLIYLLLTGAAGALLLALPRVLASLILFALLALWGVVALYRAQLLERLRTLARTQAGRWLLFLSAAVILIGSSAALEPEQSRWLLLALLISVLPVALSYRQDERTALMRGAAVFGILLIVLGSDRLLSTFYEIRPDALLLLVLGLAALLIALYLHRWALPLPGAFATAQTPAALSRAHIGLAGAGVALLALTAEASGRLLRIPLLVNLSTDAQFLLLILGGALLALGLGGARWPQRIPHPDRRALLLLALITGLGVFLRFWQLQDGLRLFIDELNFAAVVLGVLNKPNTPLLEPMSSIAAFPYIYAYWQAHTVELFGRNLIGLRAASAIVGALTIPALYLLGRTLLDRPTALIGALLLATFPPHLHFSRLGLNNIADPLFGTLALAFAARGLVHGRRLDYAAGGVFLGLTHYFYEGGRLLYTPLAALWLVGLVWLWRGRWRDLIPLGAAALIVALPIYYTLLVIERPLAARMIENQTALPGVYWQDVVTDTSSLITHLELRVIHPLRLYLQAAEGSLFYAGQNAFLLPALVPLFFLGLGALLARLRRPGPLLLLLWLLAATLGNSLLVAADHAPRYVVVFPALILLVAWGLRATWGLLWPSGRLPRLSAALLAALALTLALFQAHYYFTEHLPAYNQQYRRSWPHRDGQDAVFRSLHFPQGTAVHIISAIPPDPNYTNGVLRFMRDDLRFESIRPSQVDRAYIARLEPGIDHAFFIEPGFDGLVKFLGVYFYLLPPQNSPYADLPAYQQFPLYYAPYIPGYSERLRARLDRVRPQGERWPAP
jgi:hypothetical protein